MANLYTEIQKYTQRHKQRKAWHKVLWVLSCITVFCTTYALILPAISQEGDTYCGKTEHTHSIEGGCYAEELTCELEESEDHQHSEACYSYTLTCTEEEHTHSLICHSNPDADVETAEVWEKTFADAELTDDLSANLIAIARSQLDYAESADNYAVETDPDTGEETTKGYTRYGEWYGNKYGDWCAMFASFCMHYAGITEEMIPYEQSCARWVEQLTELGQFYTPAEDSPCVGDLVFFDGNRDGTADHVGIVTGYTYVDDDESKDVNGITTIEGNSGDKVAEREYALDCEDICGYGYFVEETADAVALEEDEGTTITWTDDEKEWIDKATAAMSGQTVNTASALIAVARSQVGYTEIKDQTVWPNTFYTIYGKQYGCENLEEWSAAFASFCLDCAGTDASFPRNTDVTEWVTALQSAGSYKAVSEGYLPQKGDLIFYTPWWPTNARVAIVAGDVTSFNTEFPVIIIDNGAVVEKTATVWGTSGQITSVGEISGFGITPFTDKAAPEPEPEPPAEWTLFSEGESITANLYQCTYDGTVTERNMTHYIPGEPKTLAISGAAYKRTSSKTVGGTAYQYHEYLIPLETVLNQYNSQGVNTGVDVSTIQENNASPFMSGRSKETFTGTVMKGNKTGEDWFWGQQYPDETANTLTAGSYVLKDGTWYLQLRATQSGENPDVLDIYYAVLEQETNTVSPASSAINLFDY